MPSNLVSIVVPVYNGERFLAEALNSVLNQTYQNWECIIVDDGSSDQSLEIAMEFSKRFPGKFRVLSQANSGQSSARNSGIAEALGEFIAFLDCDDVWHTDKLATQLDAFSLHDNLALSMTSYAIVQHNRPRRVVLLKNLKSLERDWTRFKGYGGGLESVGMIKVGVIEKLNFDESLSTSSGLDLFLRITKIGEIHLTRKVLMEYRKYPGQWHGDFSELRKNVDTIYQKHFPQEMSSYLRDFERYERLVNLKSGISSFNFSLCAKVFHITDFPYIAMRFVKYLKSICAGLTVRS